MKKITFLYLIVLAVALIVAGCNTNNLTGNTVADGLCSDLDGAAKDNCYLENIACSKIKSATVRDSCVAELAKEKNDLTACNLIKSENTKGYCQQQIALADNNVEICENIDDAYWQDNCYFHLSTENLNEETCKEIGNRPQKLDCYEEIALETDKPELCNRLAADSDRAALCFREIAVSTANVELCEELQNHININGCRYKVAKENNLREVCELIEISVIREDCIENTS